MKWPHILHETDSMKYHREKMPKTTVVFHQDVVSVENLANSQYFYTVPNTTLMYQYNGCNLNCKLKDCNSVVFLNPVSVQSL